MPFCIDGYPQAGATDAAEALHRAEPVHLGSVRVDVDGDRDDPVDLLAADEGDDLRGGRVVGGVGDIWIIGSLSMSFAGGLGGRYPSGIRNQKPLSACQSVESSQAPNGKIATFSPFRKQSL